MVHDSLDRPALTDVVIHRDQFDRAERLLLSFNPEWDQALETLQSLLSEILGSEVRLRLSK